MRRRSARLFNRHVIDVRAARQLALNIMTTSFENTTTIEYLRDHVEELVASVSGGDEPLIITVDDQPKAMLVDVEEFCGYKEFKEMQKSEALLNILNERSKQIESGEVIPLDEAFRRINEKILARKPS